MPAPSGFIGFTPSGNFPDLSTIYFPPQGTLITFPILYGDGSDAYTNHIFKLFDGLHFLRGQMVVSGTSYTRLSSTPATWFSSTDWQPGLATGAGWTANTTTSTRVLWFLLGDDCLPNGVTLTAASIKITGSPSDVGLPAGMPQFSIYKKDASGVSTQLATVTDTTGVLATYQAQHTLTLSSINVTIDRSQYVYYAQLLPENGSGSNTGMQVYLPTVTWTATSSPLF